MPIKPFWRDKSISVQGYLEAPSQILLRYATLGLNPAQKRFSKPPPREPDPRKPYRFIYNLDLTSAAHNEEFQNYTLPPAASFIINNEKPIAGWTIAFKPCSESGGSHPDFFSIHSQMPPREHPEVKVEVKQEVAEDQKPPVALRHGCCYHTPLHIKRGRVPRRATHGATTPLAPSRGGASPGDAGAAPSAPR